MSPKAYFLNCQENPKRTKNILCNEIRLALKVTKDGGRDIRKKLSKSIGIIYKMRKLSTSRVLITLYYSLFYSHLSYEISVWGNADDTLLMHRDTCDCS